MDKFIALFNKGEYELLELMFGRIEIFYNLIVKNNLISKVDHNAQHYDNFLTHIQNNFGMSEIYETLSTWMVDLMYDKAENKAYLLVDSLSDLSILFSDSRDGYSSKLVGDFLDGNYALEDFYWFDFSDEDYNYVWDSLNNVNQNKVINYLLSENIVIDLNDVDSGVFEDVSDDGETVVLNEKNIDTILNSSEALIEIINQYSEDLGILLRDAYVCALESDMYRDLSSSILKELDECLNMESITNIWEPNYTLPNSNNRIFKIELSNSLDVAEYDFIYYGSFLGAMSDRISLWAKSKSYGPTAYSDDINSCIDI